MFGDVSLGRVVVSEPDKVPVRDVLVTVIDDQETFLRAGSVEGSDGRFSVPVQEPLSGSEKLVVSTVWAVDGQIVMAVLDSLSEGRDPGKSDIRSFRLVRRCACRRKRRFRYHRHRGWDPAPSSSS